MKSEANSRHIILVEDNEDDAFLTRRALQTAGISHGIHHCSDGQAVIDHLAGLLGGPEAECRPLPDLILLDLKMPRLNGLDVLSWIRNHEVFHSLVVLALTSSNEQKDVATAYQLHINAYLVKPSSLTEMNELAAAIRHFWLDQNHLMTPLLSFPPSAGVVR